MARRLDEIRNAFTWYRSLYYNSFSIWEQVDHKVETYPTSVFTINSINICRELTKDINLN